MKIHGMDDWSIRDGAAATHLVAIVAEMMAHTILSSMFEGKLEKALTAENLAKAWRIDAMDGEGATTNKRFVAVVESAAAVMTELAPILMESLYLAGLLERPLPDPDTVEIPNDTSSLD